jgi:hypothetical protein
VLLARQAPVGVILRRSSSQLFLMVRWDLERDTFEAGQWLKARLHEHHCDLSPEGDRLLYLAAKYTGEKTGTFTAISRPPYFTALALWPLDGTWQGGGGVWESQIQVLLAHHPDALELAAGFALPAGFEAGKQPTSHISAFGPVFAARMQKDGWQAVQKGMAVGGGQIVPSEIWSKPSPKRPTSVSLRLRMQGYGEHPHPRVYELVGESSSVELGPADWADWGASGDLLLARDNRIYRVRVTADSIEAKELVDLSGLAFEEREAPLEARQWTGAVPAGAPLPASAQPAEAADLQSPELRLLLAGRS